MSDIEELQMAVPLSVMRRLLGDDVVDHALEEAAQMAHVSPERYAAGALEADFLARLSELQATSDRVRLAEEVASRVGELSDEFWEHEQRMVDAWRTGDVPPLQR